MADTLVHMENMDKGRLYKERGLAGQIDAEQILQGVKRTVTNIVRKLKPAIEAKKFGFILGLDASARVPTLMLSKIINHVYPIETRFLAVGRHIQDDNAEILREQLNEYVSSNFSDVGTNGRKILIVDDFIDKGASLSFLCSVLREKNVPYEIATLGTENGAKTLKTTFGSRVVSGGPFVTDIYGKPQMAGVHKSVNSIFSSPLNKPVAERPNNYPAPSGGPIPLVQQDHQVLAYTRKRVKEVADEIAIEMGW